MRYGSGLHSLSCNEFDMTVMAIDCETGALRSRMKSCEVAIQRLSPFLELFGASKITKAVLHENLHTCQFPVTP